MDIRPQALAAASDAAEQRIRPYIRETPLEPAPELSPSSEASVYLKYESLQFTRSFKLRGALSRLTALSPAEREAGILTASTGNHGLAVAFGMTTLGIEGTIYLPNTVSPKKRAMLERYGVKLQFFGEDGVETEEYARAMADRQGKLYVSPYNDPYVVAGQGTIGIELLQRLSAIQSVYVPVGGGGLIAGIAGVLKHHHPHVKVVGCQPAHSPVMHASIKAGKVLTMASKPTLSDGTAGGIEADSITFPICQSLVDEWVEAEENEIREAMRLVFEEQAQVIEGAAGAAVAACLKTLPEKDGEHVVIICGRNIAPSLFREAIA